MASQVGERSMTMSFGVASLDANDNDLDRLIAAADEALYCAKKAGRNCVRAQNTGRGRDLSRSATQTALATI